MSPLTESHIHIERTSVYRRFSVLKIKTEFRFRRKVRVEDIVRKSVKTFTRKIAAPD